MMPPASYPYDYDWNRHKAEQARKEAEAQKKQLKHGWWRSARGSIAGVERDEEGNIVGFSPEKFALGFAGGASATKVLSKVFQHKTAQNYAQKISKKFTKRIPSPTST